MDRNQLFVEYFTARRGFLTQEQKLMREICRTRMAIDQTNARIGRSDWDAESGKLSPAELSWNRSICRVDTEALAELRETLDREYAELAAMREQRPEKPEGAPPEPKPPKDPNERARRYREKNREKLAAQARERRARDRLVLAVAKGELDIFS